MTSATLPLSGDTSGESRSLGATLIWCLCFAFLLAPFLIFERPGLQDFANHLSRVEITLAMADPAIAAGYEALPLKPGNAAFDAFVLALSPYLSPLTGARLFVVLALVLMATGTLALRRAFGLRCDAVAAASLLFLYSGSLSYGLLPYLMGLGLALHAMALWVWVGRGHWALRLALAPVAMLLITFHLYVFAVFALFAAAETWERLDGSNRWREPAFWLAVARDGLVGVPAIILFFAVGEGTAIEGTGAIEWATFVKPISLIWALGYGPWWLVLPTFAALAWLAWPLVGSSAVSIDARARAAALAMAAAFLLLPTRIGELYCVDWRILTPMILVGLAGVSISREVLDGAGRRLARGLPILAGAMASVLSLLWLPSVQAREDVLAITAGLPPATRLFWGIANPWTAIWTSSASNGVYHVASNAAVPRRIVVSSTFAIPGQHPLRLRDPALRQLHHLAHVDLGGASKAFAADGLTVPQVAAMFDYVLVYGAPSWRDAQLLPMDRMRLVRSRGGFRLFKVEPGVLAAHSE